MKKILIFNPNTRHLKSITAVLKKNYSVYGFSAIEKASKHAKSLKPHVILLSLPQGLEAKYLNPFKELAPVIGILWSSRRFGVDSEKEKNIVIKKAFKSGIEEFIIPPYNTSEIKLKIEYCLQRRRHIGELEEEKKRLKALIEITSLVSSTLNSQEILYFIVKKIAEVIPVVRCSMIRLDHEQNQAHVVATFEDPDMKDLTIDLNKYPEIKEALITKSPVIVSDVNTDPMMRGVRDIISPLGIKSIIVLPVFYRDTIIGTLFLRTSRSGRTFTEDELVFCRTVANTSANALYNAFLYEKSQNEKKHLGRLAITDYLTGLYNTRYLYERLEEEFSRAHRYNIPLACLMVDIDRFKRINDTYGHKIGDLVLKEFADFLKKQIRKSDIIARYGGEEFFIILPNTSKEGAASEGERLCLCVKNHKFKSLKEKSDLSMSIGVITYPHKDIKNSGDLITFADTALLTAKNTGKGKVAVYS
jgi:two-component system cell cycle response regulator